MSDSTDSIPPSSSSSSSSSSPMDSSSSSHDDDNNANNNKDANAQSTSTLPLKSEFSDFHGDEESDGEGTRDNIPVSGAADEEDEGEERRRRRRGDDDDDDDDDDNDQSSRPSKKSKSSRFIDDIAEDEDDPDGEDDDYDDDDDEGLDEEVKGLIDDGEDDGDDHMTTSVNNGKSKKIKVGRIGLDVDEDDTLHLSLDQQRQQQEAESLVKDLEERYGDAGDDDVYGDDDLYGDDYDDVGGKKSSLLPSIKDPKMWLIRVDPGQEDELVFQLMKKYLFKENNLDEKLYIKSVFTHPACKGYIYVEADKEAHVKNAIMGIRAIKWYSMKLIPISEMVAAVKFNEKIATVRRGQWVRLKRGIYQNDLGKVIDMRDQGTEITVKIIPRIDILKMEEERKNANNQKEKKKRSNVRPPQKLLDPEEITALGGDLSRKVTRSGSVYFKGNEYKRGFLLKMFKVDSLIIDDVYPTSEELEKFQQRLPGDYDDEDEEEDISLETQMQIHKSSATPKATFVSQDHIIITRGAMKNITGRIKSLNKQTAIIHPDPNQPLTIDVELQLDEIRKFFKLGDHVKVISGMYQDETGLLIQIGSNEDPNEDSLILYSDVSQREIKVMSGEVIESSEVSSGRESLGNYELYDLVQIGGDAVGVIVKVEIASFKVLTTRGILQTVRLQELGQKRNSKFAVALDSHSNQLVKDDVINVLLGPHQGKRGTVKHIYRASIYCFNRQYSENSGIFVANARHIALVGQYLSNAPIDMSRAMKSPQVMGGFGSSSSSSSSSVPTSSSSAPSARNFRPQRDPLLGKQVNIIRGQYKSYIGIVLEANDQTVRVELFALARKVAVPRDHVVDRANKQFGNNQNNNNYGEGQRGMLGSETPLLGSRTPAYEFGGATPAHGEFAGGMTPARGSEDFGSRTPSHSSSHDNDVWANQTPHHSSIPEGEEEEDELERKFSNNNRTPNTPNVPRTPFTTNNNDQYDEVKTPNPNTPFSPHTPRTPITPGGRVPITPHTPHTPSLSTDSNDPDGISTDPQEDSSPSVPTIQWPVGCRIRCPPRKAGGAEVPGTVMKVLVSSMLKVHYDGDPKSVLRNLSPKDVIGPVVPEQDDYVMVILGMNIGQTGQLVGLNQGEAIVNDGSDILILELKSLCKWDPNVEKK